MGHLVAPVLPVLDLGLVGRCVAPVGEHLEQDLGGGDDARSLLLEEIVETSLPRHQRQTHDSILLLSRAGHPMRSCTRRGTIRIVERLRDG
jgi:hypothetical protein